MTTGLNFIPGPNGEFDDWQSNFVIKVNLYKAGWNWNSDAANEWALLTGPNNVKQARWEAAWAKVSSKEFLHSDEEEMKEARKAYESGDRNNPADTSLRLFAKRYITNNVKVTGQQKIACRLTVQDNVLTPSSELKVIVKEPTIALKEQTHLMQKIVVNYPGTKSRKKRKGVKEVMVYMMVQAVGVTATPAMSTFQYVGDMKRGLYTATFTDTQEGQKAFYYIREKSTRGVIGNPSAVIGIVIS